VQVFFTLALFMTKLKAVVKLSIRFVIHPSKFLIPEEEKDGRGGQMAATVTERPILSWSQSILTDFKKFCFVFKCFGFGVQCIE
jgi:hypothetical protein